MKLTFEESKARHIANGTCYHDTDYFEDTHIPNSDSYLTNCGVCGKQIMKWYGSKGLGERIIEYLKVSKTRKQIYFRFRSYSPNTIRGRLSELKKLNKIFSIEKDVFTPVQEKEILA